MAVNNSVFHDPDLYPISAIDSGKRLYTPQINNITDVFVPYPMLTQPGNIDNDLLCDPESENWNETKFCVNGFCACPYVIDVEIGRLVELVIYDEGRRFEAGHPMHLHGQHFAVVAMDK